MLDTTREIKFSLKNNGVQVDSWNELLVFIMVQRLPPETTALWEQHCGISTEFPTLERFEEFLEARFRTVEVLEKKYKNVKSFHTISDERNSDKTNSARPTGCAICKLKHKVFVCLEFTRLEPHERLDVVKKKYLQGLSGTTLYE